MIRPRHSFIQQTVQKVKKSCVTTLMLILNSISNLFLTVRDVAVGGREMFSRVSCIYSNVARPTEAIWLSGRRMTKIQIIMPHQRVSFKHSAITARCFATLHWTIAQRLSCILFGQHLWMPYTILPQPTVLLYQMMQYRKALGVEERPSIPERSSPIDFCGLTMHRHFSRHRQVSQVMIIQYLETNLLMNGTCMNKSKSQPIPPHLLGTDALASNTRSS